jgi:GWxTD domain-containing protein
MFSLLLESAVRSLSLGLLVWAGLRLCPIRSSQSRSQVWTAVLLSAVTMPVLIQLMKIVIASMPHAAVSWIPAAESPLFLRPLSAIVAASPSRSFEWTTFALTLYGLVAAAILFRLLSGVVRSLRLRKAAVPLRESWTLGSDVRVSGDLAIPATFGSTILFPANWTEWSAFEREAVLLHEQSHVRRRDSYIHLVASLHRAVFWFNPLGWWLERELLELAEESCDDDTLRKIGDPVAYAEILVNLASRRSHPGLAVLAMARGKSVERRVERALREVVVAPSTSPLGRILIAATLALLIGLAAGSRLVDAQAVLPTVSPLRQVAPQQPAPTPQVQTPAVRPVPRPAESTAYLVAWPEEEVPDIVSDQERDAFGKLRTDEEREQFIVQFWLRRDPTPGTSENEFRDEYYRRIALANRRFATRTSTPGWRTDRGRFLIRNGEPDEIESHPEGRQYRRRDGTIAVLPYEVWGYRFIEGVGRSVVLEFVDIATNGDYPNRLQYDPGDKSLDPKPLAEPIR